MGSAIERRFLIVVGEASGDAHAARMIRALKALGPCRVRGVAGPALAAAGVEPVVEMAELAVLGFSGVVARLPRIWRAYRRLLDEAERLKPDAAVLVDSPGFNFRIGPELKRRGLRVFYYIAPQVWAWHPERAKEMSRWVDRLAVVFPFEEPQFREAGVDARFVGHPLLDGLEPEESEAAFREEIGAAPSDRILGLLPGSRDQEIRHHLKILLEAARSLARSRPDLVTVVPAAPGLDPRAFEAAGLTEASAGPQPTKRSADHLAGITAAGEGGVRGSRFLFVRGRTRAVQAYSTACAVASGTATLETALFGTPLVAVYRMSALNYAIARRVVKLERVALPNIVAGRAVIPELIQRDLDAVRLAGVLSRWLDDPAAREQTSKALAVVRERLGAPGASQRAASLLRELVD